MLCVIELDFDVAIETAVMLVKKLAYIKVLKFVKFNNAFVRNTDSSNAELSDPLFKFFVIKVN